MWSLEDTLSVLEHAALVDELAARHREAPALTADSYVGTGSGDGLLARTAFVAGRAIGVKLASVFPANVDRPSVQGVLVLFDGATGTPTAVMDATAVTWFKTACDSALGSRILARPDTESMLMVGAGAMAPHLVAAHRAVLPAIERVTIWNRTRERADRLARQLAGHLADDGVSVQVADDLDAAVAAAGLVCAATMSERPLVSGALLRPGTHVDLVGAYLPNQREADDETMRRGRLFVDSRETTAEIGELAIPRSTGVIDDRTVLGDLYELCRGEVAGRSDPSDVTVFKNGGGGHLDLMTARFVADRLT